MVVVVVGGEVDEQSRLREDCCCCCCSRGCLDQVEFDIGGEYIIYKWLRLWRCVLWLLLLLLVVKIDWLLLYVEVEGKRTTTTYKKKTK